MSEAKPLVNKKYSPTNKNMAEEKEKNYGTVSQDNQEPIPLLLTTNKGDLMSVMNDFEQEMKAGGGAMPQITMDSAFAKSLRKSMEQAVNDLEKDSHNMIILDWFIFSSGALFMLLVAVGIEYNITNKFSLTQLFGAFAFAISSLRKSLSLSRNAGEKQIRAGQIKELVVKISSIELTLYNKSADTDEGKLIRLKLSETLATIWKEFNKVEINTLLPPPRASPEETV